MSYELEAVIAPRDVLARADLPDCARLARLRDGLALLPMTDQVACALSDPAAALGFGPFWRLPPGGERTLAAWSAHGPLAYVEASYHDEMGEQSAALWCNTDLLLPPCYHEGDGVIPTGDAPIIRALVLMGVVRRWHPDEFTAAGLRAWRRTEDWPDTPSP